MSSLASKVRSPTEFWKVYYSLTNSSNLLPSEMSLHSTTASTPLGKAELFNTFFKSCCNPLVQHYLLMTLYHHH